MDQPFTTPLGSNEPPGPRIEKAVRFVVEPMAESDDVAKFR